MDHSNTNSNLVFLFDVDNTLLDNDHVSADLKRHLASKVGEASAFRYWEIFEQLRKELGYADYLGALQRYRVERPRDRSRASQGRGCARPAPEGQFPFNRREKRKNRR